MKRILYYLISMLLVFGCAGSPIGLSDDTSLVTDQPEEKEIVGTWQADSLSYEFIKERKIYQLDTMELIFHEDHKVNALHLPNFLDNAFMATKGGRLLNAQGKWELEKLQNRWSIEMIFEKGELFKGGMITSFHLRKMHGSLVILVFMGDPDQGDQLVFKKI